MTSCFRGTILACVLALWCCACSGDDVWTPEREQFARLYATTLWEREKGGDSAAVRRRIDSALAKHGYSAEIFQAKMDEYSRKPELLRRLLDSAQAHAQRSALKGR